jgi:phage gp36-like protein
MAYCTQTDLAARYGDAVLVQLTDAQHLGQIDAAKVLRACLDAASEIDGYLGVRYRVPLEPVDDVVVRLACDIAFYRLHDALLAEDSPVLRGYRDAVRLLREYAGGRAVLRAAAAPELVGAPEFAPARRVFGGGGF